MRKLILAAMALLLAVSGLDASAMEYDWSGTYNAYYLVYDADSVKGWNCTDYAGNEGMLLYMNDGAAEVSVSLQERSDAPTLKDLAEDQLEYVSMYGEIVQAATYDDWYAAWDASQPGMKMRYSYTFGRSADDGEFEVVKYMAVLNDDKYLMIEIADASGDVEAVAARLEGGFLAGLSVNSFAVSGGFSAFLTGADEKDGIIYLTLQLFEVAMDESGVGYSIIPLDVQVLPLSADARIMAPKDSDIGMLANVEITGKDISGFIDGYRHQNGDDCVFNLLLSDGEIRWMEYAYLY